MKTTVTHEATMLTITPNGLMDRPALVAILDQHYRGLAVPHLLWDLRTADVSRLTLVDFEILSKVANRLRVAQENRKTAYVFRDERDFERFSGYLKQGAATKLPGRHAAFQDAALARDWLQEPHSANAAPPRSPSG